MVETIKAECCDLEVPKVLDPITFEVILQLSDIARIHFRGHSSQKVAEIDLVYTLIVDTLRSIGSLFTLEEWPAHKNAAVEVLMQAVEVVFAMFFLTEAGFFDNALILKRNYSELMLVSVAIGHDMDCYVDWKNERSSMDSFQKVCKRVERSTRVPRHEKAFVPIARIDWAKSSQTFSHNLTRSSIRTILKGEAISFEPRVVKGEYQEMRLNAFRSMLLNIESALLGIIDFESRAPSRYPEGHLLAARANALHDNSEWKAQAMI